MNFLAHAFLSGDDEEILIGNFVADAIKGKSVKTYSEGIQKGIELHRSIDTFTDKHPVFQRSRDRILEKHGKFSGVIIMIIFLQPTGKTGLKRTCRNLPWRFMR